MGKKWLCDGATTQQQKWDSGSQEKEGEYIKLLGNLLELSIIRALPLGPTIHLQFYETKLSRGF